MRKVITLIVLMATVWVGGAASADVSLGELLVTDDGLVAFKAPSGWYLTTSSEDDQTLLLAASDAERASQPLTDGTPIFHAYLNTFTDVQPEALVSKTLKEHGLTGMTLESRAVEIMDLPGIRYDGAMDSGAAQAVLILLQIPEHDQWLRFIAVGSEWDSELVEAVIGTLTVLPQQATTPRGWTAVIRAPQNWTTSEFSSFVEWIAPADSPFAGTEIWFQAGFRTDLIGQGEAPFVLRSLGVNYTSQVDESQSYATILGGLPATAQPFESFTHTGIAINADGGSDFGTANLIMRAPLGRWTQAHQNLLEAVAASVQVLPPSADAAPVGLRPGYRAPDFSGSFVDGGNFSLADYEGQLVFVHFWFVDCPYCREEWPHMQAVYNEYRDRGMVLLAINAVDPLNYIEAYMQSTGLDFPVILDNGTLHDLYGVTAFPTTFVIAPDGVVVRAARGPLSERSLRNLVEEYLVE